MKTIIIVAAISLLTEECTRAQVKPVIASTDTKLFSVKDQATHTTYDVLDTIGFYIYRGQKLVPQVKGYPRYVPAYFFSTKSTGIQPLTIQNLKNAFPSVPAFHYALDAHFRSDEELMAWDHFQQVYKVKYLLKQSLLVNK
jgi:hypothetical protein